MIYRSTRGSKWMASFEEATLQGLAPDGGLYVPERIPRLSDALLSNLSDCPSTELAFEVLSPFVDESIPSAELRTIVEETLSFPLPLVEVGSSLHVLELFHGPTKAFKDVGARFMSRCLGYFNRESGKAITILVATSGDTGSAVAHGFYEVDGVDVKILFPKGKVSPYQEYQMTSLGKNVTAIEVDGTFDDCQALVKQAFQDEELKSGHTLSSANSINVARLLPQMLYYFLAFQQLKNTDEVVVCVPSGNLGNVTAGLVAKRMGLPVKRFIAAHNRNDTFPLYLFGGDYQPKGSVRTPSNAMDVGAPSNFERLQWLYGNDKEAMTNDLEGFVASDEQTLEFMKKGLSELNYVLDPHGAVGFGALQHLLQRGETGILLETAHPLKFAEVVKQAKPDFEDAKVDLTNCRKLVIGKGYEELRALF